MGTSRETTQKQFDLAKECLQKHVAELVKQGVKEADYPNNSKWRTLEAQTRQISKRIHKIGQVEALNADVERRRAEREGGDSGE